MVELRFSPRRERSECIGSCAFANPPVFGECPPDPDPDDCDEFGADGGETDAGGASGEDEVGTTTDTV